MTFWWILFLNHLISSPDPLIIDDLSVILNDSFMTIYTKNSSTNRQRPLTGPMIGWLNSPMVCSNWRSLWKIINRKSTLLCQHWVSRTPSCTSCTHPCFDLLQVTLNDEFQPQDVIRRLMTRAWSPTDSDSLRYQSAIQAVRITLTRSLSGYQNLEQKNLHR